MLGEVCEQIKNAMKTSTMITSAMPSAPVGKAWEEVSASFDWFCLAAGTEMLGVQAPAIQYDDLRNVLLSFAQFERLKSDKVDT